MFIFPFCLRLAIQKFFKLPLPDRLIQCIKFYLIPRKHDPYLGERRVEQSDQEEC